MRIVASARPRALLSMSAQRFARSTQRVLQKGLAGLLCVRLSIATYVM